MATKNKETVEVSVELIMGYYNDACSDWQNRIRGDFPDLFEDAFPAGTIFEHRRRDERLLLIIDDTEGYVTYVGVVNLSTGKLNEPGYEEVEGDYLKEDQVEHHLGSKLSNWKIIKPEEKND